MYSGTRVLCIRPPRRVPWYLHSISCTPHSMSDPFFTHPSASCPLDFCYQTWPRFEHWGLIKCLHLPRSGSLSLLLLALALASFRSGGKKAKEKRKKITLGLLFRSLVLLRVSPSLTLHLLFIYLPHMLRLSSSCDCCRLLLFFQYRYIKSEATLRRHHHPTSST